MLKNDLLASKLHVPHLRARLVPRPQVVELLEQGIRRALTLISAPAGSGKTTILSSWLRDAEVLVAWLSLDGHDNDLHRFWTYVLAALDMLRPGMLKTAQELLKAARSHQSPSIADTHNQYGDVLDISSRMAWSILQFGLRTVDFEITLPSSCDVQLQNSPGRVALQGTSRVIRRPTGAARGHAHALQGEIARTTGSVRINTGNMQGLMHW